MNLDLISEDNCKEAVVKFLRGYSQPAFGVLPKAEVDQLVLQLLIDVGALSEPGAALSIYALAQRLKVTTSRARSLVYARELRRLDNRDMGKELKRVLQKPEIVKDGDYFTLAISSPVMRDFIKDRIRGLGLVYDSTFNQENIRLSPLGYATLITSELSPEECDQVRNLLGGRLSPVPLESLIVVGLKSLGNKAAGEFGEAVAERVSNFVGAMLDRNYQELRRFMSGYKLEILGR